MKIYRVVLGVLLFTFLVWAFAQSWNFVKRGRSDVISVKIQSSDNWELKGDFYRPIPRVKQAPGLLLLPAFGGNRTAYKETAPFFQKKGYAVLTVDLRGMGESRQKNSKGRIPNLKGINDDVQAAINFLASRKETNAARLGVLAASTICNAAVHAVDHDSRIKAVVLLSGEYDSTATQLLTSADFPPSLIVASYDDKIAIQNAASLRDKLGNPKSKVHLFLNAGHGLNMFWSPSGKELGDLMVKWFETYLK
ncbi:MAG: alpha/beta hydrolase [Calditrichaeota bacterium]|nr:alpha/beta hydrolase [Calditrichota bacterium]